MRVILFAHQEGRRPALGTVVVVAAVVGWMGFCPLPGLDFVVILVCGRVL